MIVTLCLQCVYIIILVLYFSAFLFGETAANKLTNKVVHSIM